MTDKVKFKVYRGTNADIEQLSLEDGSLYFAYDTGKIFLDKMIEENNQFIIKRFQMSAAASGDGSAGYVYSEADEDEGTLVKLNPDVDDYDDPYYYIYRSAFSDTLLSLPDKDTLIINSNGWFFRTVEVEGQAGRIKASIIAAAGTGGTGGGTGGGGSDDDLDLTCGTGWGKDRSYILGQDNPLPIVGICTRGNNPQVDITITVVDSTGATVYNKTANAITSGETYYFNTNVLPAGNNYTISVALDSSASRMRQAYKPVRIFTGITIFDMSLKKTDPNGFLPLRGSDTAEAVAVHTLDFIATGAKKTTEVLHVYVDNEELLVENNFPKILEPEADGRSQSIQIPEQSHGVHEITLQLTTEINNVTLVSNTITYQCAWMNKNETTPIVWIGNYDKTIVNYNYSYIRYMIYDPLVQDGDAGAQVLLYKNGEEIGQVMVNYSSSGWISWDITSLYSVGTNVFSISCRGVKVDLTIEVITTGSRNLSLAESSALLANYSATGRSNDEILATRNTFTSSTNLWNSSATLSNFNWQNNGWKNDNSTNAQGVDNGSYLNIANGASLTIPIPTDNQMMLLNASVSYSFEIRFRISNVQQYSTLVKTIPTYFYYYTEDGVRKKSSAAVALSEIERNGWEVALDEYGNLEGDEEHQLKEVETENGIVVKWLNNNGYGLCLGTQEAYFSTPSGVVNVRYSEDEVINISFVVDIVTHLCYIYLNGILSGAVNLPMNTAGNQITMNTPFVINSNYCDFDLYKFRIYQTGLTMPNVIHNYLSDMHSIILYDQNDLTRALDPTELDYDSLVQYNEEHPEALTMPYAVFTMEDNTDIFPRYKGNKKNCTIDFVNPSLDHGYETGAIIDNAPMSDWFYYTHSPSFHAEGVEINVQGTSSQKYPRRNWKTKYKKAKVWVFTKGPLAGLTLNNKYYFDSNGKHVTSTLQGADESDEDYKTRSKGFSGYKVLSKKFHMDNETYGTNQFTWKIDYMESSGSYNTGLANLMGNKKHPLYSKHPINDIGLDNTDLRTTVYGYPVLGFQRFVDPANNDDYNYRFVGRYNMNLDKSSNEYYGFELEDEHPYVTNPDGSHPSIAEVAECWELRDNQGTWCSFRYPSTDARSRGFNTLEDGTSGDSAKLEVIKHFEYRYTPVEDELDAAYEYKQFTDENGIVRETRASILNYMIDKYSNLEDLFNWLDSTDRNDPTNISKKVLETPAGPWQTLEAGTDIGEESEPVYTYAELSNSALFNPETEYFVKVGNEFQKAQITSFTNYRIFTGKLATGVNYYKFENNDYILLTGSELIDDDGNYIIVDSNGQFTLVGTSTPINIYESYRPAYFVKNIDYYWTTFKNDTAMYRLYKFKNEFSQHLDKEYCLVYFIITEILLCYDSRGKNMMMATFGPQQEGGNYIWYPIFYDIDTQLGLNNSGAYLWDYDEDVTENNTFSTPNSVLWNNFYDAFYNDIVLWYQRLRVNDLNYSSIVGAYECTSDVFGSWAMKGIRPIIAIGLDEYYKYIAPTTTGYYSTTEGDASLKYLDGYTYAYACQGDKKLTTELLIKNRLNYLDSRWLAGAYTSAAVLNEVFIRANANQSGTSDKFLDSASYGNDPENLSAKAKQRGFTLKDYNVENQLDARAGYKIKPYLHQYVTYFVDNQPVSSVKYIGAEGQENGILTNVSPDVLSAYKKDLDVSQQINYIPAVDYISSLGDLSLSYPNAIQIFSGKKLLDLNIGSDHPSYNNSLLNAQSDFSIPSLPLLLTANFSHLTDFGRSLDLQSSAKLQEFKAIDSTLTTVDFAPGAPLHTILLPKTTSILKLIGHKELSNIITTKPIVELNPETNKYENVSKGLYLEDVTDYESSKAGTGHNIGTIQIDGGNLEYGSYTILDNLVKLKTGATNNKDLSIFYYNIHWSPYFLVEKGTPYDETKTYYQITDHGTYILYTYSSPVNWSKDLINEIVYTKDDNAAIDTITNLNLLDRFIVEYKDATTSINQFHGSIATYATMPIITGDLYVNNTAATVINETDLTDIYKEYYPNLNITAANIKESNVTKYVNLLNSGKEETLDIIRSDSDHPQMYTALTPTKTNYDFKGWAFDAEGNDMFITYDFTTESYEENYQDKLDSYTFTADNKILKLYAIFQIHSFKMTYYNNDGTTVLKTIYEPYNVVPGLTDPMIRPEKIDSNNLGLEEIYTWKGWARMLDPTKPVDLTKITATADINFIAVYDTHISNVHDKENILNSKYFSTRETPEGLLAVGLNPNYEIHGKITVPSFIGEKPIKQIGYGISINFYGNCNVKNKLTHVFFESETCQISTIGENCFAGPDNNNINRILQYVEPKDSFTTIDQYSFAYTDMPLENVNLFLANSKNLTKINFRGFYRMSSAGSLVLPGHDFTSLGEGCFGMIRYANNLIIGSSSAPCEWTINNIGNAILGSFGSLISASDISIKIYLPISKINDSSYRDQLLSKLGLDNITMEVNSETAKNSWIQAEI